MKKLLTLTTAVMLAPTIASAQDTSFPPAADFVPDWDWNNNANMHFFAPGLDDTVFQNQVSGGGRGQFAGLYQFYVIKGISGRLTLGNADNNQRASEAVPYPHRGTWPGESWATYGFQINNRFYTEPELYLSVSGSEAGTTTGAVTKLLETPIILTTPSTHLVTIGFVPQINHSEFGDLGNRSSSNRSPSGQIVVLADIYTRPPEPSGDITVDPHVVFNGESVILSYEYDQGGAALLEVSYSAGGVTPLTLDGGGPE